jgi:hypothetical protein
MGFAFQPQGSIWPVVSLVKSSVRLSLGTGLQALKQNSKLINRK